MACYKCGVSGIGSNAYSCRGCYTFYGTHTCARCRRDITSEGLISCQLCANCNQRIADKCSVCRINAHGYFPVYNCHKCRISI